MHEQGLERSKSGGIIMSEYDWKTEVRHKCHCGHIELNEDKEENKFIQFDEKFHSEKDCYHGKETWTLLKCPKCNILLVEEC